MCKIYSNTANAARMRVRLGDESVRERCSSCRKVRLIVFRTATGRYCTACYRKHHAPKEVCSVCGELGPIAKKRPRTCYRCYWRARKQ